MQRFRQEARAASALNHPNILTIHQINQAEGRYFIATEFVDGETLRQRMRRLSLSLEEIVDIATQVGGALAAAHQAGIVHRDIKPENIMLRRDGYLKVLDFGLAKLTEKQEPMTPVSAAENVNISSGLLMGTVKYMSPEQARGMPVDPRSDIFSFGVVLYEMIAGRTPFEGGTSSELITAILKKDPPPLTDVPDEIQRVINGTLPKKREERYQTIQDLLVDLKSLKEHRAVIGRGTQALPQTANSSALSASQAEAWSTASTVDYVVSEIKRHKTSAAFVLASLAVVAVGMTFGLNRFTSRLRASSRNMRITRIPNTERSEGVAISPDGKHMAQIVRTDQYGIWLVEMATGNSTQIALLASIAPGSLTFSKDGEKMFYVSNGVLYQVPVRGGEAIKMLTDVDGPISFAPDGKQFAFVRNQDSDEETALLIANVDGTSERVLATRKKPEFLSPLGPAWSPDGSLIACAYGRIARNSETSLLGIDVATGQEKQITNQKWQDIDRLAWLPDGSGLIAPAVETGEGPAQIWHIPYPAGEARKITNDLDNYGDVGLTVDGKRLVTIQYARRSSLWIVPAGNPGAARPITSGERDLYRVMSWTPDGRILYAANTSGERDIWLMNADGTSPKQLTANAGKNLQPEASRDGRYVVFSSNRANADAFNIWRMDIDGSNPLQLTQGSGEVQPLCSPDGSWVLYSQGGPETGPEKKTVWRVPIGGGEPIQLTDKPSNGAAISVDETLIACWYKQDATSPWKIALIPFAGGPPIESFAATRTSIFRLRWTPDGQAISYINTREGISNIWSQPLNGGPPKQVTQFTSEQIEGFDWSRDGTLVCSRVHSAQDIVLISDFK